MKIVTKAELMTMPKGTPFAEFYGHGAGLTGAAPHGTGWPETFSIFHGPTNSDTDDFYFRAVDQPDNDGTEQMFERQDDMAMNGTSYPVELGIDRDGLYDPNTRYLVWEPHDVRRIINLLRGGDDERDNE